MENVNLHIKKLVEEVWQDDKKYDGNYKKIIKLLNKELKNNPDDITTLTNLGGAYCDTGKYKEAQRLLRKAIELGSKDKNTYFNLGVALINSETQEEHKVYFEKVYKLKENELTYEAYIDFQGY